MVFRSPFTYSWLLLLGLLGCGGSTFPHPYTPTSQATYPPKPLTCKFRVQSTMPDPAQYEELGTIGGFANTDDLATYAKQVRPEVCKAGGDLLVGDVNGWGKYVRGVVFRKKSGGA